MPQKNHEQAASHHEEAAKHHRTAAKHASEGNLEKQPIMHRLHTDIVKKPGSLQIKLLKNTLKERVQ